MKCYQLIGPDGLTYSSAEKGLLGGHRKMKGFGRLDCPTALRWIAKGHYVQHRVFFATMADAIDAGYRPCHSCMRTEYRQWKADPDAYSKRIILPVRTDFNFRQSFRFLARSDQECMHRTMDEQIIKLFSPGGMPALVSIGPHEAGLVLRCLNRALSQAERDSIRREVADWLDTETDLNAFYQLAESDPILEPLVARYKGLRMVTIPDTFEALSWAIIGQQINLAFAFTLKKRFVDQFGAWLDFDGKRYYTYPTAEVIAQQTTRSLCAMNIVY